MRIGIVTFHHVINDGAVLQSLAQQQALQQLLPDSTVEIVDFRYKVIEKRERFDILKNILKLRKSAYSKLWKYLTVKKFVKENLALSKVSIESDNLDAITKAINENYDMVVVGSDEIWKIDHKKFSRPFPNVYWLPQPIKVIKVASAASANTLKLDSLRKEDAEKVSQFLKDFSLIGVRDQFTFNFIKERRQSDDGLFLMPDPTFSLKLDENIYSIVESKLKKAGLDLGKPVIALSLSSDIKNLSDLSEALFKDFSKQGFQIVSIGQYNRFSHFDLTTILNPLEWAHVYRYFDFCVTDRFHSTIFCIRNHINFVSVDFSNRYQSDVKGKIQDLLSRVSLTDHHISMKNIPLQESIQKIIAKQQEGSRNSTLEAQLAKIDATLTDNYMMFLKKVRDLAKSS